MNRSDADAERLLAYVDGELSPAQAAEVEAQLAHDADAAEFVARERALRAQLQSAFAPVLEEPVPQRLKALLDPEAPAARVVDLAAERARRAPAAESAAPSRPRWPWTTWLALAASIVVGIAIGQRWPLDHRGGADWVAAADGRLVAHGALARALDGETTAQSQRAGAPVRLAASFAAQDGHYCRSFRLDPQAVAGLACRGGGQWQLQVLAAAPAAGDGSAYRQAASAMPPAVLAAIDARIGNGTPLDAAAEAAALQRGWQRETSGGAASTPGGR